MNRRQRRANRPPARITKLVACPDCDSNITLSQCGHIEVQHDDTCVWFRAFKQAGGFGIRFGHYNEGDK